MNFEGRGACMTLDELYRLMRTGHVQAQGIVDTMQQPLVVLDRSFSVVSANVAFYRTFQTEPDETVGRELFQLGSGQWDIPELRKLLAEVVPKASAILGYEVSHNFPDLGQRTMMVTARKLLHPDDYSTQMLVMFEDVTDRHKADAAKDILLAEARHRTKNLLAMLQAVAQQGEVEGLTARQYRDAFMGRVNAISGAQDFIFADGTTATLERLIARTVEPLAGTRAQIDAGPDIALEQRHVLPLSLILHELATNALKYGALSNADGLIHLSWAVEHAGEHSHLRLDWREQGGPSVVKPTRQGFGTELVEFGVKAEGGNAVISYDPDGVKVHLTLPLDR
jgi:two-component sensor histidine kinase